ncbi:MAG: DMT family transporter, partial [Chitinophagaceae bacterium]
VTLFNTFVYIAGHYSTAINMALLGTCTSPIISVILAAIFLKEKVTLLRIAGMIIMLAGILLLLSKGSWEVLLTFSFSKGDWWILAAALTFAIYNVLVKRRPAEMHSSAFLLSIFMIGTLILAPFYLLELRIQGGFDFDIPNLGAILYLGLGASVICFLLWNISISRLGAGRTALFGNLIPVFTSMEAIWILNERITTIHLVSFILVVGGLAIANIHKKFIFSFFSIDNKK